MRFLIVIVAVFLATVANCQTYCASSGSDATYTEALTAAKYRKITTSGCPNTVAKAM